MKSALPLLLLPALLMSCQGDPTPAQFTLVDHTSYVSPGITGDESLTINRVASVRPSPIVFSVSPLPAGITLVFQKHPVTDTPWVPFRISVGEVPLGTYAATITGISGSIKHTAKLIIAVTPQPMRFPPKYP